jgi:thioredoxin 2
MMSLEFAKASRTLKGRARFAKLNTETYAKAGRRYGVRGIPLLIAFRGGREVERQAGAMASAQIVEWATGLDRHGKMSPDLSEE